MLIDFEITEIPNDEHKKYAIAYLEGNLKITIGNTVFFSQAGILLIEFAIVITKWLDKIKSGELSDLVYETMDHDEPIISIIYVKNSCFKIDSIWKEKNILPAIIELNELTNAFLKYLDRLSKELKIKYDINLNKFKLGSQL